MTGLPVDELCSPVARSATVRVYPELALVSTVKLMVWLWSAKAGRLGSIARVKAVVSKVNVALLAIVTVTAVLLAARVTALEAVGPSIVAGTAVWVVMLVV